MAKKILFFLFFISLSYSQVKPQSTVMINGRAQKDKILIRWAINSPIEWQKANKKGFLITRTTVLRDGIIYQNLKKIF